MEENCVLQAEELLIYHVANDIYESMEKRNRLFQWPDLFRDSSSSSVVADSSNSVSASEPLTFSYSLEVSDLIVGGCAYNPQELNTYIEVCIE